MRILKPILMSLLVVMCLSGAALADQTCELKKGATGMIVFQTIDGRIGGFPVVAFEPTTLIRSSDPEAQVENMWPPTQKMEKLSIILNISEFAHDCPEHGREVITREMISQKVGIPVVGMTLVVRSADLDCGADDGKDTMDNKSESF